ncbi:putative ABC transport system permease protein [Paenibacillus sophorae]|uniref:FtsX-like permease family protein n=1 Tax=Paenibacillus sophorae TaxID=1333845 RepID=A0A1H8RU80_9BACL|nr:FtsX-like permease family protein [Paenibacillus sophorae]QWU16976.1 FtsX-like permease family protein [Paenibacillus sophorae]SEO69912.1 putative ABC transport system permease protein [Paenibacillus sophorae]
MYAKLSLRNAKRAAKDYLIYFVTLTLSVSLFYAFSSLSSSRYELVTGINYNLDQFYKYVQYAAYLISAILVFLVYQVNKYMIRRRKREFATYILLGIGQSNVAYMFVIETLIILLWSIVMGILLGTLFSQVLTVLIQTSIDSSISFGFRVYPDTVLSTAIFFIVIFLIIGMFNLRNLSRIKLIDMFNDERKTEIQFARGKWFYILIAVLSVLSFIFAFVNLHRYMQVQHLLAVDVSVKNQILLKVIIGIILGTYALFYSLAYFIVLVKDNLIYFKYKHTNLFLLGSLLSKINTTSMMMATVTLSLFGSILCFSVSPILSEWAKGYLAYRSVFDVQINSVYNSITKIEDLPAIDYGPVYNHIQNSEFGIKEYVQFKMYFMNEQDFYKRRKTNFPVLAISLSDYNQLRKMAGYEAIVLQDNEFAMQWDGKTSDEVIRKYMDNHPEIHVGNASFKGSYNQTYTDSLGEAVYNSYTDYTFVLPDKACKGLLAANINFYANTKKKMSYAFSTTIAPLIENLVKKNYSALYQKYADDPEFKNFIVTRTKTEQINEGTSSSLLIRIIGLYGGTILLIICLTLLALQQLSDSLENRRSYQILGKIGVDRLDINWLIFKQIGIYFSIPVITAMLAFGIFLYQFSTKNYNEISTYVGTRLFGLNICISLIMIVGIYLSYFATTYLSFKRNLDL